MDLRSRLRHDTGFWIVALAFLSAMAFSTLPSPLYAIYQERDHFAAPVVTVVFAAYALGVMASLYLAGHVSDWLGRRRVTVVALVVSALSAVLFVLWNDVAGLLVARFVNGIAIGALTATATAHLSELSDATGRRGPRAALVATVANLGGLGLGPLVGGLFAERASAPLVTPYLVFAAVFAALAVLLLLVPETVERREERPAYRPQRLSLPGDARAAFWAAGMAAFGAFAVLGMFTSLTPTFLTGTMHESSHLLAGAIPFGVYASAATAQALTMRLATRTQVLLAVSLVVGGLIAVASAALTASLPVFALAGVVAGAGVGVLFRSAIATGASVAAPGRAGETLAGIFLIAYAGLTVPVLAVGAALVALPQATVLVGFAGAVIVLVGVTGGRMAAQAPARAA
ncbi:MFS transporter [Microbacterium sp. NPDC055683]